MGFGINMGKESLAPCNSCNIGSSISMDSPNSSYGKNTDYSRLLVLLMKAFGCDADKTNWNFQDDVMPITNLSSSKVVVGLSLELRIDCGSTSISNKVLILPKEYRTALT